MEDSFAAVDKKVYFIKPSIKIPKSKSISPEEANKLLADFLHWGETVTWNNFDWRPKPITMLGND